MSNDANIPAAAPPPAAGSKAVTFLRRLLSTTILWTVVLAALFSGNPILSDCFFLVILCVLTVTGLLEFYGLAERTGLLCFHAWGIVCGLAMIVGTYLHLHGLLGIHGPPSRVNDFETTLLIVFVLGLCFRQFVRHEMARGIGAVSTTLFGMMYVAWLLNFIQKINFFPGVEGTWYVLYFIAVTKASDVGAYGLGSLIGRHKMIPRVSPGKTWEGFAGALLVSIGASLLFSRFAGAHLHGLTRAHAAVLGLLLGLAAVLGDLIESIFKREAGVKDSGRYFPGIGGILDLLDSLLFNAPLMYLYLRHILTHP
jgi:phosphatidate cytidylyltransferase